ncbi:MAG: hypothetical protein V1645_02990 [archaeon]
MEKRGQVSIEFMAIIGFVTLIAITMLIISQFYQREVSTQVETNQVDHLARKIIEASESVYYLGEPSKTTINANMPDHVESVSISTNDITFKVNVAGGKTTDISYSSNVNLTGSISSTPGLKKISIEAKCGDFTGCYVQIEG